jgi:hypothetical protein
MLGQPFLTSSILTPTTIENLMKFVLDLWKYLSIRPEVISNLVEGPSLLPTTNFNQLLPISRISNTIVPRRGDQVFSVEVFGILSSMSIPVISTEHMGCDFNAMPSVFWEYVHPPTRKGLLNVIAFQLRSVKNLFQSLEPTARHTLRNFFANGFADFGGKFLF